MFKSARLKLTGWYLLIIMLISIFFSTVIYARMAGELKRGFHRAEIRLEAEELGISLPRGFPSHLEDLPPRLREISPRFLFVEDLEAAKRRLRLNLLMVNGLILGVSAVVGYFLAGKALKPLEEAIVEQKRFVADTSHELHTPLTALKTSMEVALRDKKMSLAEAKRVIKSNLEDIDGLQSLSNNLLRLANYQDNGQSLVFKDVNIAEVVKNAHRKVLPLAKEKSIEIKTEVKKQMIQANKESLEEMLLIFLDNAVKYTPRGGKVTVTTKSDRKNLVIKVKDTGIGISQEDLPHIFDRFYRVDQSRSKSKVAGFGLGLSLAKRIVGWHQGSIEVSSAVGKGTTFTAKLPLNQG
jgi:two-component system sensor histidine kinase CiaH